LKYSKGLRDFLVWIRVWNDEVYVNYPQGKGILIWQLQTCAGDNPSDLAGRAKAAGFAWVAIKVQDGVRIYQEERLTEAISALKSNGIYVWGWGYLYGADWRKSSQARTEAQITIQVILQYQLSGFLIDSESPYKRAGARSWATVYMSTVRTTLPDIPLGLCSYRYPSYHPELPWHEFLSRCNFHAPQVYWQGSHNPGYQLRRSVTELRALRDLPLVPVGAAYSERDWAPTEPDLKEFNDTARELQLPGLAWWSWQHAESDAARWSTISSFRWEPQPEPPTTFTLEERVAHLEKLAREHGWI
jgi:hypothetical protein